MSAITLYFRYIGINIRGQLQYRASFIMMTLGNLSLTLIEFIGIWALFSRFGTLKGWNLWEIGLFYGMISLGFAISEAFGRGFDMFPLQVNSGEFDRTLLRPRTTVLQVLAHDFQLLRAGRLTQGLLILIWASLHLGINWTFFKVGLLLLSISGSVMLFTGLMIIQATMCFWSTQSLEIINSFTYGGVETAQWPLSIYDRWFVKIFIFIIPLACVNYFPVIAILGKNDVMGSPVWFQWTSPLAGLLFLLVSFRIWEFGVRHYRSTGS
ncbi:MAG: ABC transporter permease [Chloroflexi bacterium RBG_13_46_9]|nr:MAG: ABC transporter permease [Chloroflexi bacterium RBG_13_46_9]